MKKLYELFKIKQIAGDVGIEIECEGNNLNPVNEKGWKTVDDNSLRGEFPHSRCEWVLKKPINVEDVLPAMQWLEDSQREAHPEFSFRTSVHVHVNVQQLTVNQIVNMAYTYFICETVMMNYCAPHRRGNRFCLRMEDAEGIQNFFTKLISNNEARWPILNPDDAVRYAALNFEAMWKYGSIEFRGLEGTLSPEKVNTWASALVMIREFAKRFDNLQQIHDFFVKNSPNMFLDNVLGGYSEAFKYPGFAQDLRKGFSLTIDFPYAFKKVDNIPAPNPVIVDRALKRAQVNPVRVLMDDIDFRNPIFVGDAINLRAQ